MDLEKKPDSKMLTILMNCNKSNSFDQQDAPFKTSIMLTIIKSFGIPSGSTVVPSVCWEALWSVDGQILRFVSEELWLSKESSVDKKE